MKVKLLRDSRIKHKAGEIVEVSPEECFFLLSIGSAEALKEQPEAAKADKVGTRKMKK